MQWLIQYKDSLLYKAFIKLSWVDAIPIFLSLIIISSVVITTGQNHLFIPGILGTVAGSLIEKDNNFTQLLFNYIKGIASLVFTFWLMSLVVDNWGWFIIVISLSAFLWIYLGSVSRTIKALSIANINVSFDLAIIYIPGQPFSQYINSAGVFFTATILYCILSLLVYLMLPSRNLMLKMSNSLKDLANLFEINSKLYDVDELPISDVTHLQFNNAIHQLKISLAHTKISLNNQIIGFNKKSSYKMLRYYKMIEDLLNLIDTSPSDHDNLKIKLKNSDVLFRMQIVLELFATEIRAITNALDSKERVKYNPRLTVALDNLDLAINQIKGKIKTELLIIATSLRKMQLLIRSAVIRDSKLWHNEITSFIKDIKQQDSLSYSLYNETRIWQKIKYLANNLIVNFNKESSDFRYAVRMSIALFVATNLFYITNLSFTFWASTAAFLIIQPNFTLTKYRVKGRVFGTLFGASFAFIYLIGFKVLWLAIIAVVFIGLHHVLRKNYGFSTFAFTFGVLAAIEISTLNLDPLQFILRILANVVGALLASVLMVFLWPDWQFLNIKNTINNAVTSTQQLYLSVANSFAHDSFDQNELRRKFVIAKSANDRFTNLVMSLRKEIEIFHSYLEPSMNFMYLNDAMLKHLTVIIPLLETHHSKADILEQQLIDDLISTAKTFMQIQTLEQLEFIEQTDHLAKKYKEISQQSETDASLYYQQLESLAVQIKKSAEFDQQIQNNEQEVFTEKQQQLNKLIASQNTNFMEQKLLVLINLLNQYQIALQEVQELEQKSAISNQGILSFFVGKRIAHYLIYCKNKLSFNHAK